MFKYSKTARQILAYVKERYNTQPEFLWAKTPSNSVLRNIHNNKWYGVILNISKQKLAINNTSVNTRSKNTDITIIENVDILNLKCDTILKGSLIDGEKYFPGYHMNKEHWISILLDGTVPLEDIYPLIDLSYKITEKAR